MTYLNMMYIPKLPEIAAAMCGLVALSPSDVNMHYLSTLYHPHTSQLSCLLFSSPQLLQCVFARLTNSD